MGGVRTSIFGRPRPLPSHRRADLYTLNCEEPVSVADNLCESPAFDASWRGRPDANAAGETQLGGKHEEWFRFARPPRLARCRGFAISLLAVPAAPVAAAVVPCGTVVTTSITLTSDLGPCVGDALIAGADNITINLGGFTISGTGTGAGVRVAQRTGVTVTNGTIQGFPAGSARRVHRARFPSSCSATTSGASSSPGQTPTWSRRTRSSTAGSTRSASACPRTTCQQEHDREQCVRDRGRRLLDGQSGREERYPGHARIRDRGVQRLRHQPDREERRPTDPAGRRHQCLLRFRHHVDPKNIANANSDDGIDTDNPQTTITGNIANNNGDLGIEAVVGTTDGGGNVASGNGNPAQCVGVSCS